MSNVQRYHAGAIILHWLVALLLLGNIALGLMLDSFEGGDKFSAYQYHKSIGITVLLLGILRLIWRFTHRPPPFPDHMPAWEKIVAHATHWLFYALIIGIPFTGWLIVSASPMNLPTMLWGVIPWPHLPFFDGMENRREIQKSIGEIHEWLAFGTLGLWVLHVGAALRHHFMMRDETVLRMTPAWLEKSLRFIRGEKTT
jgi:cytochrome b561